MQDYSKVRSNKVNDKIITSKTDEYKIWVGIKQRCLNSNDKTYKYYGGRGIQICDEWSASFKSFISNVGPRPSKAHSIDRIDNNGNYEPGNCRWATRVEQALNKRPVTNKSGYTGVYFQGGKYRAALNISLGIYDTAEEAAQAYKVALSKIRPNEL